MAPVALVASMTLDKIAEMKRAAQAADKGLWVLAEDGPHKVPYVIGPSSNPSIPSPDVVATTRYPDRFMANDRANLVHVVAWCPVNALALIAYFEAAIADRDALLARAERAEAKIVELKDALQFVFDCFDAAGTEGLHERLSESYNEGVRVALDFRDRSLWRLVERRLLPAGIRTAAILAAIKGDEQ